MGDDYGINPMEKGMAPMGRSTGALKVIEDKNGIAKELIPLTEYAPLGSDEEYLKEIAAEKDKEALLRQEEDRMMSESSNNGIDIQTIVPKDITTMERELVIAKGIHAKTMEVKSVEPVKEVIESTSTNTLTAKEIEEKYEREMAEINLKIANLQEVTPASMSVIEKSIALAPNVISTPKTVEVVAPVEKKLPDNMHENLLKAEIEKTTKLKSTNASLTDALVAYRNRSTIAELKASYKIQLLINEIIDNTDEETSGKIIAKYYKYVSINQDTDNMLSIK